MAYVFGAMIAAAFLYSAVSGALPQMSEGLLDSAGDAVQLLISISGMIVMWSGFMRIAKDSGLMEKLSRLFSPFLRRLYPDIPPDSQVFSLISLNLSANLLGLGNAATPLGIAAMREMKRRSLSGTATDSMVTFVLMNTASIQLIPTTVAALRKSFGSAQPFDILPCVWLTSVIALSAGLLSSTVLRRVSWKRSFRSSSRRCASGDCSKRSISSTAS
ncbi:nucleoside recognition domain-containing protein [Ruminococcus sp.]|uniref:nucleoside recognition domain-containing protein n=1 Tax=Ruminococcus sp. TaxID=41978 RepID=UPI00386B9103